MRVGLENRTLMDRLFGGECVSSEDVLMDCISPCVALVGLFILYIEKYYNNHTIEMLALKS